MLKKEKRLNLKKDFRWVREGKKLYLPLFTIFSRQADIVDPQIGIALSKQQFKDATGRNRAKRLTSKAIENLYPSLRKGVKFIIIPKAQVLEKSPEELAESLKNVKDLFEPY